MLLDVSTRDRQSGIIHLLWILPIAFFIGMWDALHPKDPSLVKTVFNVSVDVAIKLWDVSVYILAWWWDTFTFVLSTLWGWLL